MMWLKGSFGRCDTIRMQRAPLALHSPSVPLLRGFFIPDNYLTKTRCNKTEASFVL